MSVLPLVSRVCTPKAAALTGPEIAGLLSQVPDWRVESGVLCRDFRFADYYEAVAFVNASAWISHRQDHHPDIALGYNRVTLRYVTHSAAGISENDFICAAKVNALLGL